jgi:hypothetical protein
MTTDLTQVSRWNYNVSGHTNSKRVKVEDTQTPTVNYFTRTLKFCLPLFLREETWDRHQYSSADITVTLNCFSPPHLWQLAIWYQIPAANSAVKASCATDSSIIFGGKAIAWGKLRDLILASPKWKTNKSVLWCPDDDNTPPLPVHSSSTCELKRLHASVPREDIDLSTQRRSYKHTFHWKGIEVVPIREKDGFLLVSRVVSEQEYKKSYGIPRSIATQPELVTVKGNTFCITDESFYFVSVEKHMAEAPR